jgi:hypothetical protein
MRQNAEVRLNDGMPVKERSTRGNSLCDYPLRSNELFGFSDNYLIT